MKQGSFAPTGLCCPGHHHYYDPLRLPLGCRPFHGAAAYRPTRSRPPQERGRGGSPQFPGQPSDRSTSLTPGGSSAPAPRSQMRSMAFALFERARLLLGPSHDGEQSRRRRLRFTLRTGQLIHPASHPASRRRTEASLPGTLASPRTGLTPAGCPELADQLRHDLRSFPVMAPDLLGALEHTFLHVKHG